MRQLVDGLEKALAGEDIRSYTTFVGQGGPRFWLSIAPAMAISAALLFYLAFAKIQDLESSLVERGAGTIRHLAPAVEYGVISGNPEILAPLLETASNEHEVRAVAVFNSAGQLLAKAGQGDWGVMQQGIVGVSNVYIWYLNRMKEA